MASSDGEDVFEVERILAEKVADGVTKYLVKWKGYADEECTWEPPDNFDARETLLDWRKQKANGDVLEAEDLRRIQNEMDAFQAAQNGDDDVGEESSEGQSDLELDEPIQRPLKRLKIVHDPPPVSSKGRSSRNPTYNVRRASNVNESTRSPVSKKTSISRDSKATAVRPRQKPTQVASPTAGRPSAALSKTASTTGSSTTQKKDETKSKLPSRVANLAPPMTFHAPEIIQRKRRPSNNVIKRDVVGKPFKNLRHQNNARKRQAEKFEQPVAAPISNPSVEEDRGPTQISDQAPQTQNNDSWLFFSEDEGETQKLKVEDQHTKPGTTQPSEQKKPNLHENKDKQDAVRPQANITKEKAKPLTMPQLQASPQSPKVHGNVGQESEGVKKKEQQVRLQQQPKSAGDPPITESSPIITSARNGPHGIGLPNRSTSGTDQEANIRTDEPAHAATSEQLPAKTPAPTVTKVQRARRNSLFGQPTPSVPSTTNQQPNLTAAAVAPSDRLVHPPARPEEPRPEWQPRHTQSNAQMPPSREYIPPGGTVKAASGRKWIRGDLVIELYMQDRPVGGVKLQALAWDQASLVVKLKPIKEHTLPIKFNRVFTYAEYLAVTKQAEWWTIYTVGAVEPFEDSEEQLSSLATFLETHDLAACWFHPDPATDLMIILYSCRSPSWAGIALHQTTRTGETRLNVAFRSKFKESQVGSVQRSANVMRQNTDRSVLEDRDAVVTDAPIDCRREPRSRRGSVVSNASSRAREGLMKSPSEQLTREMADYALGPRSRRGSTAADNPVRPSIPLKNIPSDARQVREDAIVTMTASPKELNQTTAAVDPRPRAAMGRRKESMDVRAEPSSISKQIRRDTVTEQLHTSATNSPSEGDINPPLDRRLKELVRTSRSNPSKDISKHLRVLLVYKKEDLKKAREIQDWLVKQLPDRDQVRIQPVDLALNDEDHENWKDFKEYAGRSSGALICDVNCPMYRFDGLGKAIVEHDNILCWQVDLRDTEYKPLKTTRMFPTGWATAIAQDCFLQDPDNVIYILKWLKLRVEQPYSASMIMFPPLIGGAVQEQAVLSSHSETKTKFLQLAALIQELIGLSETQSEHLEGLGFSVVMPRWEDVYSDTVVVSNQVSAVEQRARDRIMSDEFLKYFGAYALQSLTKHRKFMGFTMEKKPQGYEHVRFQHCEDFVYRDKETMKTKVKEREKKKEKERQRSKSRDPSVGRERERDSDGIRGRFQDRGGNDQGRAESRNRA